MGDVNYFMMGFLCTKVFDDVNVRKALAYGVDWAAVGQAGGGELFKQATSTIGQRFPVLQKRRRVQV